MEHIGSDARAYHTLTGRFVWDQPDVHVMANQRESHAMGMTNHMIKYATHLRYGIHLGFNISNLV